jgi:hypothetical protein
MSIDPGARVEYPARLKPKPETVLSVPTGVRNFRQQVHKKLASWKNESGSAGKMPESG